jgi:mannonate dehydratase
MRLCMMIPPVEDRRWVLARQMGVTAAIAKLAPELTGKPPPFDFDSLRSETERYRAGGLQIIGLEGDQFDMSRIKFGRPGRDEDIERYKRMLANMGALGIRLLCYNFMVGIGWCRTRAAVPIRGGAMVSAFDAEEAEALGPTEDGGIDADGVWENYDYFIRRVMPAAEEAGVVMGLHPDDPPVPTLRGLGRIFTSTAAMRRALDLAGSPNAQVTFCQGSIATMGEDVAAAARGFAADGRIAFVHIRDIRGTAERFEETFPEDGATDMAAMFQLYRALDLRCPVRPDHAPAMDGDPTHRDAVTGMNTGYEANGMIYTVGYIKGLMQANGWRA